MKDPASAQTTVRLDDAARERALLDAHPLLARLGARYELRREIGAGGMGFVLEARDRETGEVLALKVLRPEIAADPAMAERFKNELRLARRITHKNVCRIYDFNRIESLAYITMEYVDGETLRAQLDRSGALPVVKVIAIAKQITAGLSEAHAQGVVHRDLKPENIMLTSTGIVKLMDFGIARLMHGSATATQTLIGTPAYMSPEQVQGQGVDVRSDIYALGLVLYECLSGRRAFAAPTPVAVALKQVQERPLPLHSLRPDIPRALDAVIRRCLEKDRSRRFASVHELSAALVQAATATGVPASGSRRWPWIAVAGIAAGIGLYAWHQQRATPATILPSQTPAASTRAAGPRAPTVVEPERKNRDDVRIDRVERRPERFAKFEQLQAQAQAGDATAQFRLGMLYADGPAAIRDEAQARQWLERAAAQGHEGAQKALARLNARASARRLR